MAAFAKILLSIVATFLKGINLYRRAERQERELAAQYIQEIADTLNKAVGSMQDWLVPAGLIAELKHQLKNLALGVCP